MSSFDNPEEQVVVAYIDLPGTDEPGLRACVCTCMTETGDVRAMGDLNHCLLLQMIRVSAQSMGPSA